MPIVSDGVASGFPCAAKRVYDAVTCDDAKWGTPSVAVTCTDTQHGSAPVLVMEWSWNGSRATASPTVQQRLGKVKPHPRASITWAQIGSTREPDELGVEVLPH